MLTLRDRIPQISLIAVHSCADIVWHWRCNEADTGSSGGAVLHCLIEG